MPVAPILRAVLGRSLSSAASSVMGLSGAARSAVASQVIGKVLPGMIKGGFLPHTALGLFGRMGLGVNISRFAPLWRNAKRVNTVSGLLKTLSATEPIPIAQVPVSEFDYKGENWARVGYRYVEKGTNIFRTKYQTVFWDEGMSEEDILELARDSLEVWQLAGDYEEITKPDFFRIEDMGSEG